MEEQVEAGNEGVQSKVLAYQGLKFVLSGPATSRIAPQGSINNNKGVRKRAKDDAAKGKMQDEVNEIPTYQDVIMYKSKNSGITSVDRSTRATLSTYNPWIQVSRLQKIYHFQHKKLRFTKNSL